MKKLLTILVCLFALINNADAHKHRHMTGRHTAIHRHYSNAPAQCRGIPWCGCWLRLQFGLPEKSGLDLARNWMRFPKVSPSEANVVVWPSRHHVGKVLEVKGNKMLVISGNFGSRSMVPVWVNWNKAFSFHRV